MSLRCACVCARYFGWGLSDKDAAVRLAVLRALQALVLQAASQSDATLGTNNSSSGNAESPTSGGSSSSDSSRLSLMVPFVARFVPRMLECVHDADASCAAAAVNLLTELLLAGVLGSEEVNTCNSSFSLFVFLRKGRLVCAFHKITSISLFIIFF